MKKHLLSALAIAGLTLAFAVNTRADQQKTLTGEAQCAKCVAKEGDTCKITLSVKEGDKTVNYELVPNNVSRAFHNAVSKEAKKVTATGTIKEVDGKMELIPTKIDLVKG